MVIAGKEYGSGSSRDWAAKGTALLGLTGTETFDITGVTAMNQGGVPDQVTVNADGIARLSTRSAYVGTMSRIASPGMLGVHFAITAAQERLLLSAVDRGGAEVGEILEDIEEAWDDVGLSVSSDKAWDAIHRCLGDGSLDPDGSEYPLSHAVLGGRHLHDDYYVVHVTAAEVRDVAEALYPVEKTWLRHRLDAIDDADYRGSQDDKDFEYTWENFMDIRTFYKRAAKAGRAVIFTAT